jgi:hypothetical protein
MKSSRLLGPLGLLLTVAALAGCGASTRFTDMWKDPSLTTLSDLKKIAVFAITQDMSMRRVVEDELVKNAKKREVVASYTFLNQEQIQNVDYVKSTLKDMAFDAAVTMRVVGVDDRTTYVPGSYSTTAAYPAPYYSFGGYYGYATPMMYEPGYNITERYVNVETNIYRLSDEKLVWSGRSETVDPSSATELTRQIAQEAALVLQQQKLIK